MRMKSILLASALGILGAVPAFAASDNIGSVDVGYRHDRDTQTFDLGGPIDSIQLRSIHSDIDCKAVRAKFGNGKSARIFRGRLREGQEQNIDLPGRLRNVQRLTFNCGARDHGGGTIRIGADIGNHRDEWRRNPSFASSWAHLFNWNAAVVDNGDKWRQDHGSRMGRNDRRGGWELISTESFEGRGDRETSVAGLKGRRVQAIALKPLDANARCRKITAHFGNGSSRDLDLPSGNYLAQRQMLQVDLPGDVRNLESLSMNCRATDARKVSIQVFTDK